MELLKAQIYGDLSTLKENQQDIHKHGPK